MKGLLITFEGQDGSGKSTLLKLAAEQIEKRGIPTLVVPEFSTNVIGKFLQGILEKNKFLRLNTGRPSALTETMYVLSDLYSQDELEIKPALQRGLIVIKERHLDSILACQIPKITDDYPSSDQKELFEWLTNASSRLTIPDLTIFLNTTEGVLKERIRARGETVTEDDVLIFRRRQTIYDRIAEKNQKRWMDVRNDGTPDEILQTIINQIVNRFRF